MRVDSVAALPNTVLFPPDANVRQKVLAEGQRRLIDSGLIVPDGRGNANYDNALLSMTAAVADPRLIILARRESLEGGRYEATLFLNNVEIVEVIRIDKHVYRLTRIRDVPTALQGVRKMLGLPARSSVEPLPIEVRVNVFEQVRQLVAAKNPEGAVQTLIDAQTPPEVAAGFVAALAKPTGKSMVSILRTVSQKVVDVRVLGCYLNRHAAWITTVITKPQERVVIEAADGKKFLSRLTDRVASFAERFVEPT